MRCAIGVPSFAVALQRVGIDSRRDVKILDNYGPVFDALGDGAARRL
jgi:hypothetical protein